MYDLQGIFILDLDLDLDLDLYSARCNGDGN